MANKNKNTKNTYEIPNFKPLKWFDDKPCDYDGRINRSEAEDDVWVQGKDRLYIKYFVTCGASKETYNKWYIRIGFRSEAVNEEVSSMEEGKIICEHYRKLFWKEFWAEMMDSIFDV